MLCSIHLSLFRLPLEMMSTLHIRVLVICSLSTARFPGNLFMIIKVNPLGPWPHGLLSIATLRLTRDQSVASLSGTFTIALRSYRYSFTVCLCYLSMSRWKNETDHFTGLSFCSHHSFLFLPLSHVTWIRMRLWPLLRLHPFHLLAEAGGQTYYITLIISSRMIQLKCLQGAKSQINTRRRQDYGSKCSPSASLLLWH